MRTQLSSAWLSHFREVLFCTAFFVVAAIVPAAAKCGPGTSRTADGYCIPGGSVYCGGGHVCDAGEKCVSGGKCEPLNAVDCGGGHYCPPGMQCALGGTKCVARGTVDCGGGHYCAPGMVCGNGGCDPANSSTPTCGVGYHLFFPGGYGSKPECQPNRPGESGSGIGNRSTITGGSR